MTDYAKLFVLTGKVALVIGGNRDLGREMVLAFAHACHVGDWSEVEGLARRDLRALS